MTDCQQKQQHQKLLDFMDEKIDEFFRLQSEVNAAREAINLMHREIMDMCEHNWQVDPHTFDPSKTCWYCSKCRGSK